MRGRATCEKGNEAVGDREKCNEMKQCGGEKQEDKAKETIKHTDERAEEQSLG